MMVACLGENDDPPQLGKLYWSEWFGAMPFYPKLYDSEGNFVCVSFHAYLLRVGEQAHD